MDALECEARQPKRLCVALLCAGLVSCAVAESSRALLTPEALLGTWHLDLRPTPRAEPYFQELVVNAVTDDGFSGTFYGAEISEARINNNWGRLRIAFVTSDGSGPYHHSTVLDGDKLEGMSNSTGRDFLAYWSAVKRKP